MPDIDARIGGRSYRLACRPGEEARLTGLAAGLDARAAALTARLGPMAESRLLVMLALTLADELADAEAALGTAAARIEAAATALEPEGMGA